MPQRVPSDERPASRTHHAGSLHFGTGVLEQVCVVNARRTGRLAGQAPKAEIELFSECPGDRQSIVRDRAHQRDAASGRGSLSKGGDVRGAGRKAHPAVQALLQDGIIETLQVVGRGHRPGEVSDEESGMRDCWEADSLRIRNDSVRFECLEPLAARGVSRSKARANRIRVLDTPCASSRIRKPLEHTEIGSCLGILPLHLC